MICNNPAELLRIRVAISLTMIDWSDISRFGDITITAFAALAIAGWLMAEGEKRLALCWTALFGGGLGFVVATKIAFIGWGVGIHALDFTGISGHAMRATAALPVLFYLILQKAGPAARISGAGLGLLFGMLVGMSRVEVQAHSISEAVAGVALGAAISIGFLRIVGRSLRKHVLNPLRIGLTVIALLQAPYVHPAPTQKWLTSITRYVIGREQASSGAGNGKTMHEPAQQQNHEQPAS